MIGRSSNTLYHAGARNEMGRRDDTMAVIASKSPLYGVEKKAKGGGCVRLPLSTTGAFDEYSVMSFQENIGTCSILLAIRGLALCF